MDYKSPNKFVPLPFVFKQEGRVPDTSHSRTSCPARSHTAGGTSSTWSNTQVSHITFLIIWEACPQHTAQKDLSDWPASTSQGRLLGLCLPQDKAEPYLKILYQKIEVNTSLPPSVWSRLQAPAKVCPVHPGLKISLMWESKGGKKRCYPLHSLCAATETITALLWSSERAFDLYLHWEKFHF